MVSLYRLRFANESSVNIVIYAHQEGEDDFRHELFCLEPGDEQELGLREQPDDLSLQLFCLPPSRPRKYAP